MNLKYSTKWLVKTFGQIDSIIVNYLIRRVLNCKNLLCEFAQKFFNECGLTYVWHENWENLSWRKDKAIRSI